MIESPLDYRCDGTHYIVAWSFARGPSIIVARSTVRGRRWVRAVRKIGAPGFWITAHKTKRDALKGSL